MRQKEVETEQYAAGRDDWDDNKARTGERTQRKTSTEKHMDKETRRKERRDRESSGLGRREVSEERDETFTDSERQIEMDERIRG